jgi:hypothetical protein
MWFENSLLYERTTMAFAEGEVIKNRLKMVGIKPPPVVQYETA